jgi:hypothetical protein
MRLVQDLRRALDKEAADGGIGGVAKNFGTQVDLDDAIFGIVYTEKALARIFDRECFVRELPDRMKSRLKIIPR